MKIHNIFLGIISLVSVHTFAQDPITNVSNNNAQFQSGVSRDGVIQMFNKSNKILPWEPVREIDVMWKKRFWREIDIRDRQNSAFSWENEEQGDGMFIEILFNALKSGQISAYLDDRFTSEISTSAVMEQTAGSIDTIPIELPDGTISVEYRRRDFNPRSVSRYRIKEDVYFDKVRGKMFTRILGIAPLKDIISSTGDYIGTTPMFWIYYPDARQTLAQHLVYNPDNDISTMTWDDFFEKRLFASNIIKVNNQYQDDIKAYKGEGLEAMYEAEKIKLDIFNKEHDLWVY